MDGIKVHSDLDVHTGIWWGEFKDRAIWKEPSGSIKCGEFFCIAKELSGLLEGDGLYSHLYFLQSLAGIKEILLL